MASKKLTPGHNHGLPGTLASVANTKRGKETIVSALCDFLVARVVPLRKFFTSRIKSNKYLCFNELREGTENGVCRAFEAGLNSFFDPLHMQRNIERSSIPIFVTGSNSLNLNKQMYLI